MVAFDDDNIDDDDDDDDDDELFLWYGRPVRGVQPYFLAGTIAKDQYGEISQCLIRQKLEMERTHSLDKESLLALCITPISTHI